MPNILNVLSTVQGLNDLNTEVSSSSSLLSKTLRRDCDVRFSNFWFAGQETLTKYSPLHKNRNPQTCR